MHRLVQTMRENLNAECIREGVFRLNREVVFMDYRQMYENLLQTLCKAYNKMFRILEQIEKCDEALSLLTASNRPDADDVLAIASQTERLIQSLDRISLAIEPVHARLDGLKALCPEVSSHPLYGYMEDLQLLTYYDIRRVINKEDICNPEIVKRLNDYKESLELDVQISRVPQSQREVFLFVPDKK